MYSQGPASMDRTLMDQRYVHVADTRLRDLPSTAYRPPHITFSLAVPAALCVSTLVASYRLAPKARPPLVPALAPSNYIYPEPVPRAVPGTSLLVPHHTTLHLIQHSSPSASASSFSTTFTFVLLLSSQPSLFPSSPAVICGENSFAAHIRLVHIIF